MEQHTRYTVVPTAILPPGVDWVTRSPNGPLIDTGVDVAWNERGRLYLSVDTIREMAETAGLFETPDEIQERIDAAYAEGFSDGVKEELSGHLDGAVDQLGFLVDSLRAVNSRNSVPTDAVEVAVPSIGEDLDSPKSKSQRAKRTA